MNANRALDWGPTRTRTVSWHDPLATAAVGMSLSGLEYLRAMQDGELPASPIARLVDLRALCIEEGDVTFVSTPDESTYNPLGTVHGGVLCTLLDCAAASAVHSTLPAGVGFSTVELKVSYLRPARAGSELTVRGRLTKRGNRICFAEADARDPEGRLIATASSSLLIIAPL